MGALDPTSHATQPTSTEDCLLSADVTGYKSTKTGQAWIMRTMNVLFLSLFFAFSRALPVNEGSMTSGWTLLRSFIADNQVRSSAHPNFHQFKQGCFGRMKPINE